MWKKFFISLFICSFFLFFLNTPANAQRKSLLSFFPSEINLALNKNEKITISATSNGNKVSGFQIDFKITNAVLYLNTITATDITLDTSLAGWNFSGDSIITTSGNDILVSTSAYKIGSSVFTNTNLVKINLTGKSAVAALQPIRFETTSYLSYNGSSIGILTYTNGGYMVGEMTFVNRLFFYLRKLYSLIQKGGRENIK